jgi:hypothetical protein
MEPKPKGVYKSRPLSAKLLWQIEKISVRSPGHNNLALEQTAAIAVKVSAHLRDSDQILFHMPNDSPRLSYAPK